MESNFSGVTSNFNEMTSNASEYTSTTTRPISGLKLDDFLEYRISVKIHLYYLPTLLSLGIPGNVITFVVLVFSSFRKSTTSIYLAVISVLDTAILVISGFYYINREFPHFDLLNNVVCKLLNLIFFFSIHYNVILVVAVTVERFIVVVFPLKAQLWISMRRTVVVIVCCGLFSFGLNLHHVFTRIAKTSKISGNTYCGGTLEPSTKFFLYKVYPWIDSLIYCIIPLTSLFILNTIMMRHMKSNLRRQLTMRNVNTKENQSSQRQMTVMLLLVSFSFLLLTGPMGIILIVERYAWLPKTFKEKAVSRLVHSFTDNMVYTNHAINFIFYCFTGQKFRTELKRVWCCCFGPKKGKPKVQREISFISK